MMTFFDVIIIGAGAAGMMCAAQAGRRGRSVLLLDHYPVIGEKIRISGGGRCNFTNLHCSPEHYLSENPRFCISALSRYTQKDFITLVEKHGIAYHEKTLGQLFCDHSSRQIITMLRDECYLSNVTVQHPVQVKAIASQATGGFSVETDHQGAFHATSLVIASGGLAIPKIGATGFAYQLAKQYYISVIPTRPALVPLTLDLPHLKALSGIAMPVIASAGKHSFKEAMLLTHKGLSGPAILQISSYLQEKEAVRINLLPDQHNIYESLKSHKAANPKQDICTVLNAMFPKSFASMLCEQYLTQTRLADISHKTLQLLAQTLQDWSLTPTGTEGYKKAEVTAGGIDTRALSSTTMECRGVKGLYFIGECVDVTGHLGGFNFQWAWSSGYAAGKVV